MPQTTASRDRADLLRNRVATVRKAHSVARARARARARAQALEIEPPPYSHLGVLGIADHFPAMVAAQDVDRHLLGSLEQALLRVEHELASGWPPAAK